MPVRWSVNWLPPMLACLQYSELRHCLFVSLLNNVYLKSSSLRFSGWVNVVPDSALNNTKAISPVHPSPLFLSDHLFKKILPKRMVRKVSKQHWQRIEHCSGSCHRTNVMEIRCNLCYSYKLFDRICDDALWMNLGSSILGRVQCWQGTLQLWTKI